MFRIRRVFDCTGPLNRETVKQVQEIIRTQFPSIPEKEVNSLPAKLHNPMKYRFRSFLFIADDEKRQVKGFALLSHEPVLNFCFLDYISTAEDMNGRGIGGALYTRVREEALLLKTKGIFFECLPDNPKISRDPIIRNKMRRGFASTRDSVLIPLSIRHTKPP
jgi:hypothetical protein